MNRHVVLVAAVGDAHGSKAAAAALACAGSDPDRPGLLIDVGGPPPRPALVASAGARELEERFALHLPGARVASRGQICQLAEAGDAPAFERIRAALPLVRDSAAVVHVPPDLVRAAVANAGLGLTGVLLRADLTADRALTALVAAELIAVGLTVRVLKRPLAWIPERRALFGVLPAVAAGGLPQGALAGLLDISSNRRSSAGSYRNPPGTIAF